MVMWMMARSLAPCLLILTGCKPGPEVEVTPDAVVTVPKPPTVAPAPEKARLDDDQDVACQLMVVVEHAEPTPFAAKAPTHRLACAKAWQEAARAGRHAYVETIDGVAVAELLQAIEAERWEPPDEGASASTCEIVIERRERPITGEGESKASIKEAQMLAEKDVCRQVGPTCETDELGSRSTTSITKIVGGESSYRCTIRYSGRVESSETLSATSRRSRSDACRNAFEAQRGVDKISIAAIEGLPILALRPRGLSSFGLPKP